MIDLKLLKGKRVLVTGATGFIGAPLVDRLAELGADVTVLVRNEKKARRFANQSIRVVRADLSDRDRVQEIVDGNELVFNLAHDFRASAQENLLSFQSLADACSSTSVERLIHVSSIVVYEGWPDQDVNEQSAYANPQHPYQEAKIDIEIDLAMRAREKSLSSIVIQPTIVYGPKSTQWTDVQVERLMSGTIMLPNDGRGACNAVYVGDVVDALLLAGTVSGQNGERFIVSGPRPATWKALYSLYQEILGLNALESYDVDAVAGQVSSDQSGMPQESTLDRLINSGFGTWVVLTLRNTLGDRFVRRVRRVATKAINLGRPPTYFPLPHELQLYMASGVCDIEKARRDLGYEPRFDLEAARGPITEYIRRNYKRS